MAGERLAVLTPSPIGVLGLQFVAGIAIRLEIVPIGARRKLYTPFGSLKSQQRSDELDEVIGRLSEYLAGARRRLDIAYDLALAGADEFTARVLRETAKIPYGRTRTHQQVATAIGRPGAYRQVLSTLVQNPLPLLVPCHRVVPSRAGAGSYVASPAKKEWLLKMERRVLAGGPS
ncbi:MAG: methylated-DNA--[protein]-cysteine S-methyltransferase [Acidobacteriota bacterium]|nr:methylated-DNA--[protein]-cysteine S-methyltransferase [Acidobacteriota bacterium]MDH3522444.1 methylated-DNA--[protein]-cysteine S-methyltransferase [Acidobacteriota bacterium]